MTRPLVLKFGGASVAEISSFSNVTQIITNHLQSAEKLLIVVSAMGDTTNNLIQKAHAVSRSPDRRELDMLVSVGERISISLLAMALHDQNIRAISFTGSQSGIITTNDHTNAEILEVRPHRIQQAFDQYNVVIVAGFQGVSIDKNITTLGRGGSDLSAVALAQAFNSKVIFYKDVDGIYSQDPKVNKNAHHLKSITYDEMLDIINHGSSVLSERAVQLAKTHDIPLEVRSFNSTKHFIQYKNTLISSKQQLTSLLT